MPCELTPEYLVEEHLDVIGAERLRGNDDFMQVTLHELSDHVSTDPVKKPPDLQNTYFIYYCGSEIILKVFLHFTLPNTASCKFTKSSFSLVFGAWQGVNFGIGCKPGHS